MTSTTEDFRVENSFSPQPGPSGLQKKLPLDTSPDKCPICLDGFENMAYLDLCFHRFCFRCVQEWSKNKAECPLCKQPFHSIFHSVRAEDDFKEYVLQPTQNDSFSNPGGQRFRYRTTMIRDRGASFRRPQGNGVLLERLSIPPRERNNDIQHILRQFVARLQAEARSLPQIQEQEVIRFRRSLYRRGMRVQSVEDGGRFRDISSEFFRRNPACLHRLVPWLKRELTVLFGAHGSLVNIVQHIIMSNVTRYDLESQAFIDELKPFLLNRTGHFLHEFISFARSPFNIEAYDLHANYEDPAPPHEEGSQSDSSVIMISADEAETQELNLKEPTTAVTQAPWDDETPGPSYSTAKNVHTTSSSFDSFESSGEEPVRGETNSYVQGETSQDLSEDCVIVGYVKPLAERTPELVELSSDSSDSIFEGKADAVKKQGEVPFQSDSNSDASSCSNETQSVVSKDEHIVKCHKPDTSSSDQKVTSKKDKDKESASSSPRNGESSSAIKYQKDSVSIQSRKRERSSDSHSQDSKHGRGKRGRSKHRRKNNKHVRRRSSSSRSKSKRLKKRMRTRERSLSRKSKRVFPSRENRSRSRSRGHSKRRSRSRDYDHYTFKDTYGNRYLSRNWVRGRSESSFGRRALSRANYPRQHFSSEFSTQSFFEGRANARNQNHHSEDRSHHHERQRSRSRSNTRSRHPYVGSDRVRVEKPGGKRKYKTRHLEDYHGTTGPIQEDSLSDEEDCSRRPSSKFENSYKNEIGLSENPMSIQKRDERNKKRPRSLSVEIVYEGATVNTVCLPKKKKEKKKHIGNSSHSSPSVITIYIDSDVDSEEKENTRCGNNTSWLGKNQLSEKQADFVSSTVGPNENKDAPTLLADANIRADCDIAIRSNGFDNATEPLDDLPLQETSND
ncbi:E3 ubiquitin-protein ligase Topors [Tachyglossus aculeatus]|uniref:E3 ubiquitin-protein ligase Topors n=1 Tax=Tachyglossus aculeatus TaxID=9261 RepID=UPI0018F737E2|nr:E3 ubiquitin-protein ligase Topors [Tachyglossus aculeatus]